MGIIEKIEKANAEGALGQDLREAARIMTGQEARFLVGAYYKMQEERIRWSLRTREGEKAGTPVRVAGFMGEQSAALENYLKVALDAYSGSHEAGVWARSQKGIGPVLAAALLAYIDIEKADTVSSVWRFAGLDPTSKWEKGTKRPWNADLKKVCWLIGESFIKVHNREDAVYGVIYKERKALEVARNEAGDFAETAARILKERKVVDKKLKARLEEGRLSDGHINSRARRYAVKMFLSHFWQVWREIEGLPTVSPYPVAHMGHAHVIKVPGWPLAA